MRVVPRSLRACTLRAGQGHRPATCKGSAERVRVTGRFGSKRLNLGTRRPLRQRGHAVVHDHDPGARAAKLWSPARPYLYPVKLKATVGRARGQQLPAADRHPLDPRPGDGRLLLNGKRVNLRGVGVHEESQAQGFAVDNAFRSRLVSEVKAVGATLMRTHYPLHPYTQELADKEGVLDLVGGPGLHAQARRTSPSPA